MNCDWTGTDLGNSVTTWAVSVVGGALMGAGKVKPSKSSKTLKEFKLLDGVVVVGMEDTVGLVSNLVSSVLAIVWISGVVVLGVTILDLVRGSLLTRLDLPEFCLAGKDLNLSLDGVDCLGASCLSPLVLCWPLPRPLTLTLTLRLSPLPLLLVLGATVTLPLSSSISRTADSTSAGSRGLSSSSSMVFVRRSVVSTGSLAVFNKAFKASLA